MKALITGCTGQDGSYLAELLLKKGYEVHAFIRRFESTKNIAPILPQLNVHDVDLLDFPSMLAAIQSVKPDEVYHLASQSFVGSSFDSPVHTGEVTGMGTLRLLEAIRMSGVKPRIYNAATSEMYGGGENLDESTPFAPKSPYGSAKLFSYWLCRNYRESYGLYVSNGILFNHESIRRGSEFVTKRIAEGVARIKRGESNFVTLGNLTAKRDWGWAPEYVAGMVEMLKLDEPTDMVLATGEAHSVREFATEAFKAAGIPYRVLVDSSLMRPNDIQVLSGNPAKARRLIGWEPKVRFTDIVQKMVAHELE